MPCSAIHAACTDFVLPRPAIAAALAALVVVPGMSQFFAVANHTDEQPYCEALRRLGDSFGPSGRGYSNADHARRGN